MPCELVVTSVFDVQWGKEGQFGEMLRSFADEVKQQSGCQGVEVHHSHENYLRFKLEQRWTSMDIYCDNTRLPYFKRFFVYAETLTGGEMGTTTWIASDSEGPKRAEESGEDINDRRRKRRRREERRGDGTSN